LRRIAALFNEKDGTDNEKDGTDNGKRMASNWEVILTPFLSHKYTRKPLKFSTYEPQEFS